MRGSRVAIACSVLALVTAPGAEGSCLTGNRPGATLLFPYFEVDLEDPAGRTTLVAIENASADPVVAHGVLWTNWGLPTFTFDLYLKGHGVETLSLRDVLNGEVPATGTGPKLSPPPTIPGFPSCIDPISNSPPTGDLQAKHLGKASPVDGLCYASPADEPGLATGYLTVDAMNDCSPTIELPSDDGYFVAGGTGLASNRNVLAGDFFLIDPGGDSAQGLEAVALVADADVFDSEIGPFNTFYRQGRDARAPLSTRLRTRYLLGGVFDGGTDLLVWTEGKGADTEPLPCDDPAVSRTEVQMFTDFRDQRAAPLAGHFVELKERTRRFAAGEEPLPLGKSFGTVDLRIQRFHPFPGLPPPPDPLQTWVTALIRAEGRFSVGMHALRLDDPCELTVMEDRR